MEHAKRPNRHERVRLERRRNGLKLMADSMEQAEEHLAVLAGSKRLSEVRIRTDFVYRSTPAPGDDRRLPIRRYRPPATRLVSPRGAALRLYLLALFEAQATHTPGVRPNNRRRLQERGQNIGWTDLVASPIQDSAEGKTHLQAMTKRLRQIQDALGRLSEPEVQLVSLPNAGATRNKYEHFQLLDEAGARSGPQAPYVVPRSNEPAVTLPIEFFTRGWIYALDDTELTFVLMLSHNVPPSNSNMWMAIAGADRVQRYCVSREAYEETHKLLGRLGILEVMPDSQRAEDGKVEGFHAGVKPHLHSLRWLQRGFRDSAHSAVVKDIEERLAL